MKNVFYISKFASKLLETELKFDLGGRSFSGDVTSTTFISGKKKALFSFVAREPIKLCGINFLEDYLKVYYPKIKIRKFFGDGEEIVKNQRIAEVSGNCRKILSMERTLLNFLQHLSSISTTTSNLIKLMGNTKTQLLDTRKTSIGLRLLEKYATSIGGAINHRLNLKQRILIKDNHLILSEGLEKIMKIIKKKKIKGYQIECDTFEQTKTLMELGCNHFLLDNMKVSEIKKCINLKKDRNVIFEVSGGINFRNIKKYSQLGADYISVGSITNNKRLVDIGLDII